MTKAPGRNHHRAPGLRVPSETIVVGALALMAAITAVVLSRTVFAHLSINNDEGIYRLQADALAHGHLFGRAPHPADSFRPWLAAVVDSHYVLKYTPLYPAVLALSAVVTGGPLLALAAVAAGAVAMTYLLAVEVLGDRREALGAAALFSASPLILIQSGLLLPYLFTVLLLEAFAWGLVRGFGRGATRPGRRVGTRPALLLAGTALGLALVARPYDAVLFGAPVVVGVLGRRWREHLTLRRVVLVAVPLAVALGGFLAFNAAATGRLLKPTFSLLEPRDALGFGDRYLYPTDIRHDFGPRQAVDGLISNGSLLVGWSAGGAVMVALAAATLARRRAPAPALWLTGSAALLVAGYGFFWGPWNAASQWGGTRFVGPFYFLPVVVPLTILAARSLVDVVRRQVWAGAALTVAMVGLTAVTLTTVIVDNSAFERNNRMLHRLVADHVDNGLVFAVLPDPFLMHPTSVVANGWSVSGSVVYAVQGQSDLDAMSTMPTRSPWQLSFDGSFIFPDQPFSARLQPLKVVTGAEVSLPLVVRPTKRVTALSVTAGGTTRLYPLDLAGGAVPSFRDSLVIGARSGAHLQARQPATTWPAEDTGTVILRLLGGRDPGPATPAIVTSTLPTRTNGDSVEVLAPSGPPLTTGRERPLPIELDTVP